MISLADESPFLPYEEKDQGGIVLCDTNGVLLIHTWYPQRVVHYLNFVPLSAKAGVGEVNRIGDGLAAWYGRDFRHVILIATLPTWSP